MAYNVADCAHNKVCTNCPSRVGCDVRKLFYDAEAYEKSRTLSYHRAHGAARARHFSDDDCDSLAEESVAVMDFRRTEELKLHPTYSVT